MEITSRQREMKLSPSLCHVIVTYKVSNKGTSSGHHDFTVLQLAHNYSEPREIPNLLLNSPSHGKPHNNQVLI